MWVRKPPIPTKFGFRRRPQLLANRHCAGVVGRKRSFPARGIVKSVNQLNCRQNPYAAQTAATSVAVAAQAFIHSVLFRAASLQCRAVRFLCHVYKRTRGPSSHSYAAIYIFGRSRKQSYDENSHPDRLDDAPACDLRTCICARAVFARGDQPLRPRPGHTSWHFSDVAGLTDDVGSWG
jgi:hypothetical protein